MNELKAIRALRFLWKMERKAKRFQKKIEKDASGRKICLSLDGSMITGSIGEMLSRDIFGVELAKKPNQKGFDGFKDKKRVEVKTQKTTVPNEELKHCTNKTVLIHFKFDDDKKLKRINIMRVLNKDGKTFKEPVLSYFPNGKKFTCMKLKKDYNGYDSWLTPETIRSLNLIYNCAYAAFPKTVYFLFKLKSFFC